MLHSTILDTRIPPTFMETAYSHFTFETSAGSFTVELYRRHAPLACLNLSQLAKIGESLCLPRRHCDKMQLGRVLQRHDLPPDGPGLHDPGRRPDGHRARRRERLRRKVPDEIAPELRLT